MEFDTLLVNHLGELGNYQILILLFVSSVTINSALNNIDYVFTGARPTFRCDVGVLNINLSFDQMLQLTSPHKMDKEPNACLIYQYNYSSVTQTEAKMLLEIEKENMTEIPLEKCHSWVYSGEYSAGTIVSEWDLVCDREWFISTSQAVYMTGMFTVFIGGFFSDRFGRRPVALACLCLEIVCRFVIALAPNIYVFIIGRFLLSSATVNRYVFMSIIAIESVGPSKRVLAGLTPYFFWSVGYMIIAGMAYFIRDWKTRNLSYLIFTVPFVMHFCFLKESVRWLLSVSKHRQALDVVRLIARINKKQIPDEVIESWIQPGKVENRETRAGILQLFRSRSLIKITVIETFIWFTVNAVYYGLIFYIPDLRVNIYLSTLISGALELPALIYVQFTLDTRLGRRYNTFVLFLLTGIVMFVLIFIPNELVWLRVTLAFIGRFAITAIFAIIYISTAEIYPTKVRTIGLSICSSASRFGSVLSPYLAWLGKFGLFLPPLIFGLLSTIGAVLYLLLPETKGQALQNFTIQAPDSRKLRHREYDVEHSEDTAECLNTNL